MLAVSVSNYDRVFSRRRADHQHMVLVCGSARSAGRKDAVGGSTDLILQRGHHPSEASWKHSKQRRYEYTVHSAPSPPPTQNKQRSRLRAAVNVVTIHDPLPGRFFSTLNLRLTPGPRPFRRSSKTSPIPHQPTMPHFLLIRPA
jgi:hypothetical protein